MNISFDADIPFPRVLVFQTYRDKLVDLVPYLPNVRHIEVQSRQEQAGKIQCVNVWHGGGEIPAIARAFLSEEMLSWTEYNLWDEAAFTLEWRIETHGFTAAVSCVGKNTFVTTNGTTVVENRGQLVIAPHQLDGVPPFLRHQVAGIVEDFLGHKVGPNLRQMSEGVCQYLKQKGSVAHR